MKIIEGMKRLRLIEKKMDQNKLHITQYASTLSTERPFFGSDDAQRKEVASLIQSNNDLMTEYLKIKKQIEQTNLDVGVNIMGKAYTLSDLLIIKRKLAEQMTTTYESLNTNYADTKIRSAGLTPEGKRPEIVRMYDEKQKNEELNFWMELSSQIESKLEVVNAITDLVE